jgi:MoxR-like ATPase
MEINKSEIQSIEKMFTSFENVKKEVSKVIIGQDVIVNQLLMTIFSGGHSLLIGVPGLAKTLLVNTVARTIGLKFNRIQFTPDLMPSDIIGSEIIDENRNFKFVEGPIFGNIILADEINRTPPKTQSALLEAMQEHSVTVSGKTYNLDPPFFVLATQNPIEQEGTYPLPEAQLDRFMFSIIVDYPNFNEELDIVKRTTSMVNQELNIVLTAEDIISFQKILLQIPVTDTVYEYAINLVRKTRPNSEKSTEDIRKYLDWGAGPRASQYLIIAAKINAVFSGKYSPDIEDVRAVAFNVLRHRLVKNYKAEAEGVTIEQIINNLF